MSASPTNCSSPPSSRNDVLLCFLAGGDDILKFQHTRWWNTFNSCATSSLSNTSSVEECYTHIKTSHCYRTSVKQTRSVAWLGPGWCRSAPPPSPDPPVWARDRLLTNILSIFGSCDDPRRSPASLPGAGSRQQRGKFPPRTTSSLLPGWGPAPFPALTVSGQRLSVNSCLHHTTASPKLRWHTLTCRSCAPFWTSSWEIEDFFSDSCSLLTFFLFLCPFIESLAVCSECRCETDS